MAARRRVDGMDLSGFLELARMMGGPVQLDELERSVLAMIVSQLALHLPWHLAAQIPPQMCKNVVEVLRELHPNSIAQAASEGPFVYLYSRGDLNDCASIGFPREMTVEEAKKFSERFGDASVWLVDWPGYVAPTSVDRLITPR